MSPTPRIDDGIMNARVENPSADAPAADRLVTSHPSTTAMNVMSAAAAALDIKLMKGVFPIQPRSSAKVPPSSALIRSAAVGATDTAAARTRMRTDDARSGKSDRSDG